MHTSTALSQTSSLDAAPASPWLEAVSLSCAREGRWLFRELSFRFGAGEVWQLAGPNGVGKTSLMRTLAGLLPIQQGEVCWRGQTLAAVQDDYQQQLLFMGHLAGIKAELTPLENLSWYAALEAQWEEAELEEALMRVGLWHLIDTPCHQLSAGQKRRVALARLLITRKPFWLLDEPFTALDKEAVQAMERLIRTHAEQGGCVLLTSHHALEDFSGLQRLELTPLAAEAAFVDGS
ncbi:cytochrome c biogenesis heme-transporting ATPase CcmA [Marinospirillum sp. MEB164]|uniref:Cytochrome c biogenesis heme-transporting ATPase CcmA n=1 Tax=Marinospirillum alkalitolerans TaxID=3123374 RepID=A0ABW8PUV3_9GAMM